MTELKQTIGFWQGIGLLVTTLLGTGVFILPEVTVKLANSSAIYAWILLALAILPIAFVFAELGKHDPHAAGISYYVEKALGSTLGKASGLMFILLIPVGAPAALDMIMQFAGTLTTFSAAQVLTLEIGLLGFMWLLNYRGVQASGAIQLGLTIAMLAVVISMVVFASGDTTFTGSGTNSELSWSPMVMAMAIAFWSFMGIEALTHLSAEFKNPKRDFLPAMVVGTLLVAIIYVICTWLVLPFVGDEGLLMVSAFDNLFGGYGNYVVGLLGIASGFATVNVYSTGISRLTWSYANEGLLPQKLAKLNRHQVPTNAYTLIVSAVAVMVVAKHTFEIPFETLILWANGVVVLLYFLTMLAAYKLLPGAKKGWAVVGAVVSTLLIYSIGKDMLYALVLLTVIASYLKLTGRGNLTAASATAE